LKREVQCTALLVHRLAHAYKMFTHVHMHAGTHLVSWPPLEERLR